MQQKSAGRRRSAISPACDTSKQSGLRLTIASSDAKPPNENAEIAGRVEQPGLGQQRADQARRCRPPSRAATTATRDNACRATAWRARAIAASSRAISAAGAVGMSDDVADFANLVLHLVERARHRQFGEVHARSPSASSRVERLSNRLATTTSGFSTSTSSAPPDSLGYALASSPPTQASREYRLRARESARDRPASAATGRCRHSSRRCAAASAADAGVHRAAPAPQVPAARRMRRITYPPTARSRPRADTPRDRR